MAAASSQSPNVKGLLSDPRFKALDLPTQKQTLGRLDQRFSGLSDSDYQTFVSRMTTSTVPAAPAAPKKVFGKAPQTKAEMNEFMAQQGKLPKTLGSPVLPGAQIIPAAVGYGVEKLGEKVGLPWWAAMPAGMLAGGIAAGSGSIYQRIKDLPAGQRAEAFKKAATKLPWGIGKLAEAWQTLFKDEPAFKFEPGAATRRNMPAYGGPTAPEYSPPAGPVKRLFGKPARELEPPKEPEAAFKFEPGTATKRNMPSYGGPTEPEYGPAAGPVKRIFGKPARKLGPLSPSVKVETTPQAPKPFKPSAVTKRNMPKYGGAAEPSYGPAPSRMTRRGINRAISGGEPPQGPKEPPPDRPAGVYGGTDIGGTQSRDLDINKFANIRAAAKNDALGRRLLQLNNGNKDAAKKAIRGMTEAEYNAHIDAVNAGETPAGMKFERLSKKPGRRNITEIRSQVEAVIDKL